MRWYFFRLSTVGILLIVLAVQVTLSSAEETKKRVIIKVPTRIKHIYHHHTKKIHIHKGEKIQHKPDVHVVVEEEVHPQYPKWKARSKPYGKELYESSDWDEGLESRWKPQGFRAPAKWREESYDDEEYDNGPEASDDYYNYEEHYRKGRKKGRHSNSYRQDAHFSPSDVKTKREPYSRRPRQPAERDQYSSSNQAKRKQKYRGSQSSKNQKYKEDRPRPDASQKVVKEAWPEMKNHPKTARWSKPMSLPNEYIEGDDFVPLSQGQLQNGAEEIMYQYYQNFNPPEIEKGFEPSGYSPLSIQTNSFIHTQPQVSPTMDPFNYPAPQPPASRLQAFSNQPQQSNFPQTSLILPVQQPSNVKLPRNPPVRSTQVWTPSPTVFKPPLPPKPSLQPSVNVFHSQVTTRPSKNVPGFHNEIAMDQKGKPVGYQSHVGHNMDANHPSSSFQSVVFGQRIKPPR